MQRTSHLILATVALLSCFWASWLPAFIGEVPVSTGCSSASWFRGGGRTVVAPRRAETFRAPDQSLVAGGDGIPPWMLQTLPAGLGEGVPLPPVQNLRPASVFHRVGAGGVVSSEVVYARELWQKNGALIVVVRRPGCWMSREQARVLSETFASIVPSLDLPGMPKLIAVVRASIDNDDGTNEVELFREFFPGEVVFDPYLSTFKALGDRQYTDNLLSREGAKWMLQRMVGLKNKKIDGNFVGGPDTALKFGGCMVVDRDGEIHFSHQEGNGSIDYEEVKKALANM